MIINVPSLTSSTLDSGFQVGDILETTRTDLSDDWLECDGSEVSASEYPELAGVLPSVPLTAAGVREVNTGSTVALYRMKYVNGYYIGLGASRLVYSTSLDGPWTEVSAGASYNYDIIYANGYWVLYASTGTYGYIYYATSLDGTWTVGLSAGKNNAWEGGLFYYNNKFIVVMSSSDYRTYIYTASVPNSWTLANTIYKSMWAIEYSQKRERWETTAAGSYSSLSIAYSTDLINWTASDGYTDDKIVNVASRSSYLGIDEKYWNICIGKYVLSFLPDGTFCNSFLVSDTSITNNYSMTGVRIGDGEFVYVYGENYLRSDPDGEFLQIDTAVGKTSLFAPCKCDDGEVYICGNKYDTSGVVQALHGIYLKYRPNITVPDVNGLTKAYIKAK